MCRVILILCYSQWSWRERRWSSPEWRGHVTLAPKRCPRNKKPPRPRYISHSDVKKLRCHVDLQGLPRCPYYRGLKVTNWLVCASAGTYKGCRKPIAPVCPRQAAPLSFSFKMSPFAVFFFFFFARLPPTYDWPEADECRWKGMSTGISRQ